MEARFDSAAGTRDPVDLTLLDIYESERRPVAAWVLSWNHAQISTLEPTSTALRREILIRDLIDTKDGTNLLVDRVRGLSLRYQLGNGEAHAHVLVGSSAPDFELNDGSKLGRHQYSRPRLLVDFGDDPSLNELVIRGKYEARVDYLGTGVKDTCGLRALLIRPDGFVAWIVEENRERDIEAAKAALEKWFSC